jgi:DNA-binding response OmpR family regulator
VPLDIYTYSFLGATKEMALPNILVVDSEEGFGLMLREGLANSGHYTAQCVHTGSDALQAITAETFDLIIIDMGLTDMSPANLVKSVRQVKSDMRIMMIPLMGQQLPKEMEALNINGVLTKPFFVGDLPDLIDSAMGRRQRRAAALPVEPAVPEEVPVSHNSEDTTPAITKTPPASTAAASESAPTASDPVEVGEPLLGTIDQETIRFLRANEAEILRSLDDLNREVRAEAILLIAGPELISHAGLLSREQCQSLAMLVGQSSQAAAQAANFLGEPSGQFMQSLHEGTEYRLYSLSLGEGILLSLALSSNVPLGMIRHQCRQTGETLAKFII